MTGPLSVIYRALARAQLAELHAYIAKKGTGPLTADRYLGALLDHCDSLATFPSRGVARDDLRPGLRMTHFKGRTVVAYAVHPDRIDILGIYYGGQNVEAIVSDLD